uniref:Uncharacterized protein n=1 Tax=Melopsittacus undulatus TaxID=13146 RepID=A0A8V5FZC2_MELUD
LLFLHRQPRKLELPPCLTHAAGQVKEYVVAAEPAQEVEEAADGGAAGAAALPVLQQRGGGVGLRLQPPDLQVLAAQRLRQCGPVGGRRRPRVEVEAEAAPSGGGAAGLEPGSGPTGGVAMAARLSQLPPPGSAALSLLASPRLPPGSARPTHRGVLRTAPSLTGTCGSPGVGESEETLLRSLGLFSSVPIQAGRDGALSNLV